MSLDIWRGGEGQGEYSGSGSVEVNWPGRRRKRRGRSLEEAELGGVKSVFCVRLTCFVLQSVALLSDVMSGF